MLLQNKIFLIIPPVGFLLLGWWAMLTTPCRPGQEWVGIVVMGFYTIIVASGVAMLYDK